MKRLLIDAVLIAAGVLAFTWTQGDAVDEVPVTYNVPVNITCGFGVIKNVQVDQRPTGFWFTWTFNPDNTFPALEQAGYLQNCWIAPYTEE